MNEGTFLQGVAQVLGGLVLEGLLLLAGAALCLPHLARVSLNWRRWGLGIQCNGWRYWSARFGPWSLTWNWPTRKIAVLEPWLLDPKEEDPADVRET